MKKLLLPFVLILVCLLAVLWFWRQRAHVAPLGDSRAAQPASGATSPPSMTATELGAEPGAAPVLAPPTVADPEFQKWLSDEAKDVDQPKVDVEAKQRELARVVANLTPAQAHLLLVTALNDKSPSSERILAIYILGEGGEKTRAELVAVLTAPLKDRGAAAAHSEGEVKGSADRARAAMAVDALAAQAKKDPAALVALGQAMDRIHDPYVKAYAQKRLESLRGH